LAGERGYGDLSFEDRHIRRAVEPDENTEGRTEIDDLGSLSVDLESNSIGGDVGGQLSFVQTGFPGAEDF